MAAVASEELQEQWNALALTKFRAPRLRRDVISRAVLLERLLDSVEHNPVTLVCAPGGSGKTTLLTQLFTASSADLTVLWASIDADDDDANRFFASLVQAVQPLQLTWEVDPRSLVASVAASKAHARAALAALVNALCTTALRRVVLVLDDLHRIDNPEAFELLDSLVERLPDHIALVLGSRVEPPLSLARWRAYGELGAFGADDLQFTLADAAALAQTRGGGAAADERVIREAVHRTHGWAAGLMLLLQSRSRLDAPSASMDDGEANRHLFQYLAQEVLHELPQELQDFVLRSSILLELDPRMCCALTGRADSRRVLEELYRRNLFLTALDETTPVLRFHDLFREFLEAELLRTDPALKRDLHVRAAAAESIDSRAVYHLLQAQRWDEAMARIIRAGEERVAHGGVATVERWIRSIPESIRAGNAALSYLHGSCAWFHWDWPLAKRELAHAADALTAPAEHSQRVRAIFHLVDALNSSGDREGAMQRLDQASRLPLDELGQAQLALQRAWCLAPAGDPEGVARCMAEFVEHVERDPRTICPATADRIHCMLIGVPGVADAFERFHAAAQLASSQAGPWQISALTVGAWVHLWRGRKSEALAVIEEAERLQHQFGATRLVVERLAQLRVLSLVARRSYAAAATLIGPHIEGMQSPQMAGHGAVWLRPYRLGMARVHWAAQDRAGLNELAPDLLAPPTPSEWPFVAVAIAITRGQLAVLNQRWDEAERAYREALQMHDRLRLPMVHTDARIGLAYVLLQGRRRSEAWDAFAPVYAEVVRERAIGLLLLEPPIVIEALLECAPLAVRKEADYAAFTAQWARWCDAPAPATSAKSGLLAPLSERECEVLAQVAAGASNKHIARQLSLSLHTVKRHIANILDKLDCDSRGQAADLFRRAGGAP